MSGLAVRPASADDVAAAVEIAQARPYTAKWSAEAFAAELERPDSIFLVAADDRVRGYALARVVDRDCRLLDLGAASDGAGYGRALLSALGIAARERGCALISWEVSSANARARDFYAKAGAKVVGRRPKFYYDGSDAVLMDLNLR
jgi:ribosomal protein S18 acetylase RimI-like enzyme